ncbi:MAG: metallophosphoesterase family protein [Gemmatimonadaceae bacterium]
MPPRFEDVMRWSAGQLKAAQATAVAAWPSTVSVDIQGIGRTLFCHATPRNDTEIFTQDTDEMLLAPVFRDVDASLVVCGHTHMQFDRRVGQRRVVNAGSVGMPFGEAGAYWLLLGPEVQLQRSGYDLAAGAQRVRESGYPLAEEFATQSILSPPPADMVRTQYAKVELR